MLLELVKKIGLTNGGITGYKSLYGDLAKVNSGSLPSFPRILRQIREFVEFDDSPERSKRAYLCGICWFDDCIATTSSRLKLLTSRRCSSINTELSRLSYVRILPTEKEYDRLCRLLEDFASEATIRRTWVIRRRLIW
jgi:hypothetical protein